MSSKKRFITGVFVCILILCGLFATLFNVLQIGHTEYYDLNDQLTTKITYSNGETKEVQNELAAGINQGDQVTFTIQLPDKDPFQSSSLCFYQYHSLVKVYVGEECIYTFGEAGVEAKQMLGNEYMNVEIPDNAWGKVITITSLQMEASNSDHSNEFRLLPTNNVRLYPLIHRELDFFIFMMADAVSLVGLAVFCIVACYKKNVWTEIFLSAFILVVSTWHLGANRMFTVFITNPHFNGAVEYVSAFILPIPMFLYFSKVVIVPKFKKIFYVLAGIFTGIYVFATCMDLFAKVHYPSFETLLYLPLAISMFVTLGILIAGIRRQHEMDISTSAMVAGSLLAAAPAAVKLTFMFLRNSDPANTFFADVFRIDFYTVSLSIFLIAMVVSLCLRVVETIRSEAIRTELKKMAYVDLLTEIHNRNYCVQQLSKYDKEEGNDYGIVFFDADKLKNANDLYGHEVGDDLIKATAECIQTAFGEEDGFFGRWGGDEFIAVLDHPEHIPAFEERFQNEMERINATHRFPFPFHISYGRAVKKANHAYTTTEICNLADERMYENKKIHEDHEEDNFE